MAHVEKRDAKRWRARWVDPDGMPKNRTFPTKKQANAFLVEIEGAKNAGVYVDPGAGNITVAVWCRRWLDGVSPTLKPSTRQNYETLLRARVAPGLGKRRLNALRPSDIQTWIGALDRADLSPSWTRKCFVLLKQALDAAVRDRLIGTNPAAAGIKLPRIVRREATYFEPAIVDQIAGTVPDPYGLLVRILGWLGLRFGEAAALQRQDVDVLRRRLIIDEALSEVGGRLHRTAPKSHAVRAAPLPAQLLAELVEHLDDRVGPAADAPLFTGPAGGPLRHSAFYHRVWRPTLKELGLPAVGLHTLRHSAAARLIAAGASPKAIQTILGHASASFSLTVYGHLFPDDLDDVASRIAELPRPARVLGAGQGFPPGTVEVV